MGFNDADAAVICRQLGLPWSGARGCSWYCPEVLYPNAGPGTVGTSPFATSAVQCTGNEDQIADCPHFRGVVSGYSSCNGQDSGEEYIQKLKSSVAL